MTINCDFCQKDISHLYDFEYLCSCGKKTCSPECHRFTLTHLVNGNGVEYSNVCIDEVLKNGKKGMIVYDYCDPDGYEGTATIEDPNYAKMVENMAFLKKKVKQQSKEIKKMAKQNRDLQTQIDCMPGGKEYLAAKERFEEQDY